MLRSCFLLVAFCMSFTVQADKTLFLDENLAYCFSERSITRYMYMAEGLDIDGLNRLALSGQCDFVHKDGGIKITHYQKIETDSNALVAFKKDGKTLWTIKTLTTTAKAD